MESFNKEETVIVKVHFRNDIKRFSFQGSSFEDLVGMVRNVFGLSGSLEELHITYIDLSDGFNDKVTIGNDNDLALAMKDSTYKNVLRIWVSKEEKEKEKSIKEDVAGCSAEPSYPEIAGSSTHENSEREKKDVGNGGVLAGLKEAFDSFWNPGGPWGPHERCGRGRGRGRGRIGRGILFGRRHHHHLHHHRHGGWEAGADDDWGVNHEKRVGWKRFGRMVADVTVPKDTIVHPGQLIRKTWRIRNEGYCEWPAGTTLCCVDPGKFHAPNVTAVPPENLLVPGQEGDVSVDLVAPREPGLHTSKFQLFTPYGNRGERLKVRVIVATI
jgi:hypothetical protein